MNKYTPEDILARLQAGATIDELAQEFTDALNDAKALQEEEAKKAEAEARAKSARRTAMQNLIDALGVYIDFTDNQEYKDYFDDKILEIQEDEEQLDKMCDSVDQILEFAVSLDNMVKLTFPLQKEENKEAPVEEKKRCSDRALADFLTMMGW